MKPLKKFHRRRRRILGLESLESRRLLAAEVIIGADAPDQNFLPFSSTAVTRYQQVYAADQFPGVETYDGVKFFYNPPLVDLSDNLATGTLNFEFSITSRDVDALDTVDFDNNVTDSVLGIGTLELSGGAGRDLIIDITPFTYDPSLGNLLIDIQSPTGLTRDGFPATFAAYSPDVGSSANGIFSRVLDGGADGFEGFGLKTAFLVASDPIVAPEVQVMISEGNLTLTGDDGANEILIEQGTTADEFVLRSSVSDFGEGPGVSVTVSGITGNVLVALGAGADTLLVGATDGAITLPGDLIVDMGAGDNIAKIGADVTSGESSSVEVLGDVDIKGGSGGDEIRLGGTMLGDYNALTGNVGLNIDGDVTLKLGDGDNSTMIGGDVGYYSNLNIEIAGDFDVKQSDGNNTTVIGGDSYYGRVSILIDGDVSIHNGDGVNRTDVGNSNRDSFSSFSQLQIGKDLSIRNGNGGNLTRVGMDAYYSQVLRVLGDVEVSNGNGNDVTTLGGSSYYDISSVSVAGDVSVRNRQGNDVTRIGDSGGYDGLSSVRIEGDLSVADGSGDDDTRIGGDGGYYGDSRVTVFGDVQLTGAQGNDVFRVGGDGGKYGNTSVEIQGDFRIGAGKGEDVTEMGGVDGRFGNSSILVGGGLSLHGGADKDKLFVRARRDALLTIQGELRVSGGEGNDNIRVQGASVSGTTVLRGGEGNDKIRIRDSIFDQLVKVNLGDESNDLFEDLGGNVFDDGFVLV